MCHSKKLAKHKIYIPSVVQCTIVVKTVVNDSFIINDSFMVRDSFMVSDSFVTNVLIETVVAEMLKTADLF